jgi:hypothetical protein
VQTAQQFTCWGPAVACASIQFHMREHSGPSVQSSRPDKLTVDVQTAGENKITKI